MQKLNCVTTVVDKQVVVKLVGDVDASNARSFRRYLAEAADLGAPVLLLDLAAVRRMDSAGVAVLVELFRRFERDGRTLALVRVSSAVRKILDLLRTGNVLFDTYHDLDEGLRVTKKLRENQARDRMTRLHDSGAR